MRTPVVVAARVLVTALVGCTLAALAAPGAAAQCPTSFMLTGTTQFGQAIAVSGDFVLVGDATLNFGGTAVVLRRADYGWKAEYSMFSPQAEANGRFGDAVAIAGEWAAVGAPGELDGAGAVHLFHRECAPGEPCAWVWAASLTPAEAAPNDRFGTAVALDGTRLLVSAPSSDLAGPEMGAAFVFEESGGSWTQVQTLTPGDGAPLFAGLGGCVALAGDVAVAGSKSANVAWLFVRGGGAGGSGGGSGGGGGSDGNGGFGPAQMLSDPNAGQFGAAVATDGARVLVGSPGSNATTFKSGEAYLFAPTAAGLGAGEWMQSALLVPPGYALFAAFGSSVALDGHTLAVGATGANAGHGALHVFHDEGAAWSLYTTFDSLPGPAANGLGVTAALDDDTLVVGARILFGPPGVVYTLGGVATWTDLGGGLAGSAGLPALAVGGSLCGGDTLTFTISHGQPDAAALLIVGLAATPQPWKGGVLWPAPDVVVPALLGASGGAALTLHVPIGEPAGQPVIAQAWIADTGAPAGVSATPAVTAKTP